MPYITSVHESLPYIDAEPTPDQRAAAEALIAAERATQPDDPHHALLREEHTPKFSEAMQAEIARAAAKKPLDAIDLTRYEVDDESGDKSVEELQQSLAQAYTAQTYLRGRRAHLALLDSYGKNAWLVGNWQVEADVKRVEADLAATKRDIDVVTVQRQRVQQEAAAEMRDLEATWRTGVGRVLETEAAAEELRLQVLEARRQQAGQ
ncbi:bcas2 family protein [Ophiostoma piceae UAMH 11346]|uniref:Bcas2 family protein n=1 Tax=Ophiostoma piceae (strain UAMH 11346) TaxID=1262450 RepID=S3BUK2_OPHP1|nr:bcas2 family protein [Ophiostoma piceae UAMH 11346]